MNTFFQSKTFKKILIVLVSIIVALVIFQSGMVVGYHKAEFSNHLDEQYGAFINHPHPVLGGPEIPGQHGTAGTIVNIALPSVTVADVSGVEKTIVISDDTIIREFQNQITTHDLVVGMHIVVFGDPLANSEIQAKFIRAMPSTKVTAPTEASSSVLH